MDSIINKLNIKGVTYNVGGQKSSEQIEWSAISNLNDYTTKGDYEISGKREQSYQDSMPIIFGGNIHANLTVWSNEDGSYVSQVISFDNINAGDYVVYTRVRKNNTWEEWSRLQTNREVNAIGYGKEKTFDDFTESGIYSGVNIIYNQETYSTYQETFVLVVINDVLFDVGGVCQLKYSLDTTGYINGDKSLVTIQTRLKPKNGNWDNWLDINKSGNVTLRGDGVHHINGDINKVMYITGARPSPSTYYINVTSNTINFFI